MFLYALEMDDTGIDDEPIKTYFCFVSRKFMVLGGGCQTQLHRRLIDVEHYQSSHPGSRIIKFTLSLQEKSK